MRFSERIGKRKVKCKIQTDSMDADLKNGLWSVLYMCVIEELYAYPDGQIHNEESREMLKILWFDFFKWPIDEISYRKSRVHKTIRDWFFAASPFDIYDLINYIGTLSDFLETNRFKQNCNTVLEKELSAYRFVGKTLTPITDKIETGEIEEAMESSDEHKLKGVRSHLESALEKLSDRENPDYRNSIKESISAVESLCKVIVDDANAKLGGALKLIEKKIGMHPALTKGFLSIYGYTSDEGGIRHALIDEDTCSFDDAKYMLVSCSAFVNYLIMKASKAGIIQ